MSGKFKTGFTLLELMIAIVLIGIMATVLVPTLFRSQSGYERKKFIADLNSIVRYGQQNAITSGKTQQVFVDVKKKMMELRTPNGKKDSDGQDEYKLVSHLYAPTHIEIPSSVQIKNFIIEGFDEVGKYTNTKVGELWFFIVPEGLTQEVIINFLDTNDKMYNGKPRPIGLVLNPFTAQFKEYDTFQK